MTTLAAKPRTRPPAEPRGITPGVIRGDEAYAMKEFMRRTNFGVWAMRGMRRRGLKVIQVAGRSFVRGSDFLAFLDAHGGRSASLSQRDSAIAESTTGDG